MQGDEDAWLANTKKFTEATGVEVRVDKESWEDIRPKAAVAANVGSGPDMVLCWFDDPHQYPDKLVDVTDLGTYLDGKYGGFYDGLKGYAMRGDKYIALPLGRHRQRHLLSPEPHRGRGLQGVPEGYRRLPRTLQGDAGQGHARRLRARQGGG